jgi:hypothetical protein
MKMREVEPLEVIMICINNSHIVAEAEIEDRHHIIIKITKGRGVEAGIEGGAGNQVTLEDVVVSSTIIPQEAITPRKVLMHHLIIHNMKGGEAAADRHIKDTTTTIGITTTEMKGTIMKKEEEIIHITSLIIITVNNTPHITRAITKKTEKDLHQIHKDMVSIIFIHLYKEDYRMKSGGSNYFRAPY